MPKYEAIAKQFCDAIRNFDDKHIDNLECYLSYHFSEWMEKFASTPEDLTCEMCEFSNMIICYEEEKT